MIKAVNNRYEHYIFEVKSFECSSSFGVNLDERQDRAFNEHFHLTLTAQLLNWF